MPFKLPFEDKMIRPDLNNFSYDIASKEELEEHLCELQKVFKELIHWVAVSKHMLPKLEPRVAEIQSMINDSYNALNSK